MNFVLDASVTMAWCFESEVTDYSEVILDRVEVDGTTVPSIWPLEVANALLNGERRRRLMPAQSLAFVERLAALPIMIDGETVSRAWGAVLAMGREYRLSAYDAAYLELAARRGLALATQDARLRAAATRLGVPLLA